MAGPGPSRSRDEGGTDALDNQATEAIGLPPTAAGRSDIASGNVRRPRGPGGCSGQRWRPVHLPDSAWLVIARMQDLPKVEPPFERIVGPGAGPIKELSLPDADRTLHTPAEWAGRPAAVLVFLAPNCPVSRDYADELASLAREFGPRGIVFLGYRPDAGGRSGRDRGGVGELAPSRFRSSFDPARRVVRQAGVEVTPTAVVILPDGQVIYRGRIDDRYSADGRKSTRPGRSDLQGRARRDPCRRDAAAQRRGRPRHPAGPDRRPRPSIPASRSRSTSTCADPLE